LHRTRPDWHRRLMQIFDPNHGEFEFPDGSGDVPVNFFGDLWSNYRTLIQVRSWRLYDVFYPLGEGH
jgi:hypothetical protein